MADQTRLWPGGLMRPMGQRRDVADLTQSPAHSTTLSSVEGMIVIQLLVMGSAMQAYANEALEAVLVTLLLLIIGIAVVALVFPGRKEEMRAFLLMYAVSVFVGGLAQCYSLAVFNRLYSTADVPTFLRGISPKPPFTTMARVSHWDAPLAVVTWQQVYKLTWWLGLKFGLYTGVMFNALVMGLVGSLTVQIARELFGDDAWRLRRAGTLAASCGLFILFGSVLIRDCFTTFLSTLALWGIVRWLARPTSRNLLFATGLTGLSAWAMQFLRLEAVLLFAIYGFSAFICWLIARASTIRMVVAALVLVGMVIASSYLGLYFETVQETQSSGLEGYLDLATRKSSSDSLGMRLIYNQPLPVRLVLGFGMLMINPIPLWNNFEIGMSDYHWIKGYNGIYQVFVLPLVCTGVFVALRIFRRDRKRSLPLMFLVMYMLMNTVSVVATSMEQRHIGQFMTTMVTLAALPDTRETQTLYELRHIRTLWFAGVILVHLAWAALKLVG